MSTKATYIHAQAQRMNGTCILELEPDLRQASYDFGRSVILSATCLFAINLGQTS